jgi:hypothetical protein
VIAAVSAGVAAVAENSEVLGNGDDPDISPLKRAKINSVEAENLGRVKDGLEGVEVGAVPVAGAPLSGLVGVVEVIVVGGDSCR